MELSLARENLIQIGLAALQAKWNSNLALEAMQRSELAVTLTKRERALQPNQPAAAQQTSAKHLWRAKMAEHQSRPRVMPASAAWQSGPPQRAFSAPAQL